MAKNSICATLWPCKYWNCWNIQSLGVCLLFCFVCFFTLASTSGKGKKIQWGFQLQSSYLYDLLVHVRWELDRDSATGEKNLSELLKSYGKWLLLTVVKHFVFHWTFIFLFELKLCFSLTKGQPGWHFIQACCPLTAVHPFTKVFESELFKSIAAALFFPMSPKTPPQNSVFQLYFTPVFFETTLRCLSVTKESIRPTYCETGLRFFDLGTCKRGQVKLRTSEGIPF